MIKLLKSIENDLVPMDNQLENFITAFKDEILILINEFNEIKDENSIFNVDYSLPSPLSFSDKFLPINFKSFNNSKNDLSLNN